MCGEKAGLAPVTARARGSPPRVRGKGNDRKPGRRAAGITPACAGKSKLPLLDYSPAWDHPRVCGEKVVLSIFLVPLMGSPPRVRGKERQQPRKHRVTRITPACAGKSLTIPKLTTRSWDHPRVCGEKSRVCPRSDPGTGSPPRVRGKARGCLRRPVSQRITPACAGKSVLFNIYQVIAEDHPRVCGEKARTLIVQDEPQGSPPRVRGKAALWRVSRPLFRITPACAGKSAKAERTSRCSWDHPRVCGEKDLVSRQLHFSTGSPPRVRGKGAIGATGRQTAGITPACAGKRSFASGRSFAVWDHPRVCGEKILTSCVWIFARGSPPRVRGKGTFQPLLYLFNGITPACAGKRGHTTTCLYNIQDHPRVCGEKAYSTIWGCQQKGSPPRVRGKVCRIYKNAA